jgi:hypothetical protein
MFAMDYEMSTFRYMLNKEHDTSEVDERLNDNKSQVDLSYDYHTKSRGTRGLISRRMRVLF